MSAPNQLKALVERIERIEEEIKDLNDGKRDIYAEAKSNGFDVLALKTVIARRRKDPDKLQEHDALVELYLSTLSGVGTVPATRVHEAASWTPEQIKKAEKREPRPINRIEPASTAPAPVAQPSRPPVQAIASLPQQTPAEFYAAAAVEAQQVDHSDRNGCPAFLDRRV